MLEELYIIGGIGICILLAFLMFRKRKKVIASENETGAALETITVPKAPPPLPIQRAPSLPSRHPNRRALDYPKCPLDRSRNEPGKPQVIFWDNTNNCYTCCHGHHFTGRE